MHQVSVCMSAAGAPGPGLVMRYSACLVDFLVDLAGLVRRRWWSPLPVTSSHGRDVSI